MITGATAASLTLTAVTPADAAIYTVVATNLGGSTTSTSAALVVIVPPAITTQPIAAQTIVAGNGVTFTVAASGTPTPTYQWRKDGAPISGATSSTLNIASVTLADAATYTVVATNAAGTATSSNAVLTVHTPPAITSQPVSTQTVAASTSVTLTGAATGTPTPTLQWRKDGVVIPGATGASLTLSALALTDSGTYTLVATNIIGTATSSNSILNVVTGFPPLFTTQPTASQTVIAGNNASFTAAATGTPAPTFQWQKNGVAIAGATSTTLTLTAVT
ncbi:MAG: immunoglobulin domain-containing protein, partial [Chitinophagaceae bacterium]|nr:immunoglobulin domain-containing protein [Rubrivivax sp.]